MSDKREDLIRETEIIIDGIKDMLSRDSAEGVQKVKLAQLKYYEGILEALSPTGSDIKTITLSKSEIDALPVQLRVSFDQICEYPNIVVEPTGSESSNALADLPTLDKKCLIYCGDNCTCSLRKTNTAAPLLGSESNGELLAETEESIANIEFKLLSVVLTKDSEDALKERLKYYQGILQALKQSPPTVAEDEVEEECKFCHNGLVNDWLSSQDGEFCNHMCCAIYKKEGALSHGVFRGHRRIDDEPNKPTPVDSELVERVIAVREYFTKNAEHDDDRQNYVYIESTEEMFDEFLSICKALQSQCTERVVKLVDIEDLLIHEDNGERYAPEDLESIAEELATKAFTPSTPNTQPAVLTKTFDEYIKENGLLHYEGNISMLHQGWDLALEHLSTPNTEHEFNEYAKQKRKEILAEYTSSEHDPKATTKEELVKRLNYLMIHCVNEETKDQSTLLGLFLSVLHILDPIDTEHEEVSVVAVEDILYWLKNTTALNGMFSEDSISVALMENQFTVTKPMGEK